MHTMPFVPRRMFQRRVQNPLAMRFLQGDFEPGDAVAVDFRDGVFTFEARAAAPAPGPG